MLLVLLFWFLVIAFVLIVSLPGAFFAVVSLRWMQPARRGAQLATSARLPAVLAVLPVLLLLLLPLPALGYGFEEMYVNSRAYATVLHLGAPDGSTLAVSIGPHSSQLSVVREVQSQFPVPATAVRDVVQVVLMRCEVSVTCL